MDTKELLEYIRENNIKGRIWKNCMNCPLSDIDGPIMVCLVKDRAVGRLDEITKIPDWCPLDLASKLEWLIKDVVDNETI